ncbi:hypothetical protein G7Y89_g546 [Cudoniella acicularis]|uniref:Inosine/uridine-preferring nucleoside hydrolase domain-containing protein n=1 Tax=Cudoniella acicularis TaxID=354080 RepID=A0A8H4RX05_9HELO|nr:hypothetical protein G7Y89_g546 [Cudoniella acicularis]
MIDPEAAKIALTAPFPSITIAGNVANQVISSQEFLDDIYEVKNPYSKLMYEYYGTIFPFWDETAMALLVDPSLSTNSTTVYLDVDVAYSSPSYGNVHVYQKALMPPNIRNVTYVNTIDGDKLKAMIKKAILEILQLNLIQQHFKVSPTLKFLSSSLDQLRSCIWVRLQPKSIAAVTTPAIFVAAITAVTAITSIIVTIIAVDTVDAVITTIAPAAFENAALVDVAGDVVLRGVVVPHDAEVPDDVALDEALDEQLDIVAAGDAEEERDVEQGVPAGAGQQDDGLD